MTLYDVLRRLMTAKDVLCRFMSAEEGDGNVVKCRKRSQKVAKVVNPEGPNLEKIQDRPPGFKFSSEIETNDIFKRD